MSTEECLSIASTVSGVLPVFAALYNYKQLDRPLKIAAVYFLASVLSDSLLLGMKNTGSLNNFPVIHIYILVSILLLGALYFYAFFNPIVKKITLLLTTVTLIAIVLNMIFFQGILEYPSFSNTALNVTIICFSLAYFYQLLTRQEFVHIEKQGLFWINAGMLFYFSINIFLFMLFERMLLEHRESFYMINNITNIIANILFIVGLLCKPQKVTSYQY